MRGEHAEKPTEACRNDDDDSAWWSWVHYEAEDLAPARRWMASTQSTAGSACPQLMMGRGQAESRAGTGLRDHVTHKAQGPSRTLSEGRTRYLIEMICRNLHPTYLLEISSCCKFR